MTPRKITLPLANDRTETHCGSCAACEVTRGREWRCHALRKWLTMDPRVNDTMRLPKCIEAEASQAALERDATKWRRIVAEIGDRKWPVDLYEEVIHQDEDTTRCLNCIDQEQVDLLWAIAAEVRGEHE
jgi:hypothetical protein